MREATIPPPASRHRSVGHWRPLRTGGLLAVAVAFVGWCVFPFYIMITTALKTDPQIFAWPPVWLFHPVLRNMQNAFFVVGGRSALFFLMNSIIVTAVSTILAVLLGSMTAYGLARFHFPGDRNIAFFILSTRFAPPVAFVIPTYVLVERVGLLDTRLALIIVYTAANVSFVTWILRGFFVDIPKEIEEAALVDGYRHIEIFWRVALPLIKPGVITTGILCAVFSWNEFLYAMILTQSRASTLPVYLSQFSGSTTLVWDQYMAVGVIAVLPVLLAAWWLEKHLVRGMTFGAVR